MLFSTAVLLLCAVAIYFACEYFVNSIEWLGTRLRIGQTATGTVLAAFGTALPESAVTATAVLGSNAVQKEIGVGAALGGPLVLATFSYAVVGVLLLWRLRKSGTNKDTIPVNGARLRRDQFWFMAIFIVKIGLGCVLFSQKAWFALFFLAAYGAYVYKELCSNKSAEEVDEGELEPLLFQRDASNPAWGWILLQVIASTSVIAIASHYFVGSMESFAYAVGMPGQWVALLLSPLATELPETMNAIIWVRQGKERLALANISGAMMIQATIPSAFGIAWTPWMFDGPLLISGLFTLIAIAWLSTAFRRSLLHPRHLIYVGILYALFWVLVMGIFLP